MFAKKCQVMLCDQSDQIISWDGIYKRRKKKKDKKIIKIFGKMPKLRDMLKMIV